VGAAIISNISVRKQIEIYCTLEIVSAPRGEQNAPKMKKALSVLNRSILNSAIS